MPREVEGHLSAAGLDFSIVVSRFNDLITSRLLDGAVDALRLHGADDDRITVYRVPGAKRASRHPCGACSTRASIRCGCGRA